MTNFLNILHIRYSWRSKWLKYVVKLNLLFKSLKWYQITRNTGFLIFWITFFPDFSAPKQDPRIHYRPGNKYVFRIYL